MTSALLDYAALAKFHKQGERMTEAAGRRLVQKSGVLDYQEPLAVLDNACGTGIITTILYEKLSPGAKEKMQLTCGDYSPPMLAVLEKSIETNEWKQAKAQIIDATKTGLPDSTYTHVLTNMGIMAMPDGIAALKECFRILKPGGICAFSTLKEVGWLHDVRAAFESASPPLPFPDDDTLTSAMGDGNPWRESTFLSKILTDIGFEPSSISTEEVPSTAAADNAEAFSDIYTLILGGLLGKVWSAEEKERCGPRIREVLLGFYTEKYGEGKPFDIDILANVAVARKL